MPVTFSNFQHKYLQIVKVLPDDLTTKFHKQNLCLGNIQMS